jgi:hypothetical protein
LPPTDFAISEDMPGSAKAVPREVTRKWRRFIRKFRKTNESGTPAVSG